MKNSFTVSTSELETPEQSSMQALVKEQLRVLAELGVRLTPAQKQEISNLLLNNYSTDIQVENALRALKTFTTTPEAWIVAHKDMALRAKVEYSYE